MDNVRQDPRREKGRVFVLRIALVGYDSENFFQIRSSAEVIAQQLSGVVDVVFARLHIAQIGLVDVIKDELELELSSGGRCGGIEVLGSIEQLDELLQIDLGIPLLVPRLVQAPFLETTECELVNPLPRASTLEWYRNPNYRPCRYDILLALEPVTSGLEIIAEPLPC